MSAPIARAMQTKKVLIVEESGFQRGILAETMRSFGAREVQGCASPREAQRFAHYAPDILLLDWNLPEVDGLAWTRQIRRGETVFPRDVAIIMITARSTLEDVETARRGGVDEFMIKPFTTQGLEARLKEVLFNRRPFVDHETYVGPCRRRRFLTDYQGPKRRERDDSGTAKADPGVALTRKLDEAAAFATAFSPTDVTQIKTVLLLARDLRRLAGAHPEPLIATAAGSLMDYVCGVGATGRFDVKVLEAHIDAMRQLVALGLLPDDMRERVAAALSALVKRKLARA